MGLLGCAALCCAALCSPARGWAAMACYPVGLLSTTEPVGVSPALVLLLLSPPPSLPRLTPGCTPSLPQVWHFDLGAPPDKSDVKTVDLEFTR